MRSKSWLKTKLLPRIVNADVAEARHVRYLARDALPRTFEKQAEIHDDGLSNIVKQVRPKF